MGGFDDVNIYIFMNPSDNDNGKKSEINREEKSAQNLMAREPK